MFSVLLVSSLAVFAPALPSVAPSSLPDVCLEYTKVVCVSKKAQKLRLVVNGQVKVVAKARFGRPGLRTRNGLHSVYWRSKDHVSSTYNAPMPFALFFFKGQAVHFSPDFLNNGYSGSSHGCVNLRSWVKARKIFMRSPVGTPVYVYGRLPRSQRPVV